MDKDTNIKSVGQPIFKQIIKLPDTATIDNLVLKHHADRYYKVFNAKTQLITMLFVILS
ncbi:MAG: DUF4372 domain-containing protein [Bacteroidia bacterium]